MNLLYLLKGKTYILAKSDNNSKINREAIILYNFEKVNLG